MNQVYIFNGSAMLSYFQSKHSDRNKIYTSFNEAMCWGNADKDIFSSRFVEQRCLSLNTTFNEYTTTVIKPLEPLLSKDRKEIKLWFDSDMFCQINLLTLLAYLDQIDYHDSVEFNLVDYNNEILETNSLTPKGYKHIYETVVINKTMSNEIELPVMKQGIELYIHLQKEDNEIVQFIRENADLSTSELLNLLFKNFQHYGLGDVQYMQMIEKIRP